MASTQSTVAKKTAKATPRPRLRAMDSKCFWNRGTKATICNNDPITNQVQTEPFVTSLRGTLTGRKTALLTRGGSSEIYDWLNSDTVKISRTPNRMRDNTNPAVLPRIDSRPLQTNTVPKIDWISTIMPQACHQSTLELPRQEK